MSKHCYKKLNSQGNTCDGMPLSNKDADTGKKGHDPKCSL